MFCGKCGKNIPDGAVVCPYCGKPLADDKTKVYEADRTVIADGELDSDKTMFIETQPETIQDGQRMPENFDYDEPSIQDFSEDEYYPPAVPNYDNQPSEDFSADEDIPKAYRNAKKPVKRNKKSNAPLIVILVILITILLAACGFLAWHFISSNSGDARLDRAQNAVLAGDYTEAENILKEDKTAQAEAVKAFAQLMKERDSFAADTEKDKLYTVSDGVVEKANALIAAFNGFDKSNALPEKLKEKYDLYSKRLSDCTQATSKLGNSDLINAQKGVRDFAARKRGESFSIADLEDTVSACEPAVAAIEQAVTGTGGYKELISNVKSKSAKAVSDFFTTVSAQLEQDKFDLENYRKNQNDGAEFALAETDESYKASLGEGFAEPDSDESLKDNADRLWHTLLTIWVRYSFDINQ